MKISVNVLDDDTLSLIFQISTDTFDISGPSWINPGYFKNTAADFARDAIAISQVCLRWRELTLNTPVLWARLVNFNPSPIFNSPWSSEVIRRSDNAPLRIRCALQGASGSTTLIESFLGLLDADWHRTQYIMVTLIDVPDTTTQRIISLFRRPAPVLVTFNLQIMTFETSINSPTNTVTLFENHAPLLRDFLYLGRGTPIDVNTFWLPNIKYLSLCLSQPSHGRLVMCPEEIIPILRKTPLLKHLNLNVSSTSEGELLQTDLSNTVIALPFLHTLHIGLHWRLCSDIIRILQVNTLKTLSVIGEGYTPTGEAKLDFEEFTEWWMPSLREHLSVETKFTQMVLEYSTLMKTRLRFIFKCGDFSISTSGDIDCGLNEAMQHTQFFERLSTCNLQNITKLTYSIDVPSKQISPHRSHVIQILSSLSQMRTLKTIWAFVGDITSLMTDVDGAFPCLQTLEIPPGNYRADAKRSIENIRGFLQWRVESGNPIQVLKLETIQNVIKYRWDCHYPDLQQFRGLKVIWVYYSASGGRNLEYTIGDEPKPPAESEGDIFDSPNATFEVTETDSKATATVANPPCITSYAHNFCKELAVD